MKTTIDATLILCLILFAQGCGQSHTPDDGHDHGAAVQSGKDGDAHAALHKTKYNETLVEFPGHKYAMEIIDDDETGLVTAFLTDAHFDPIEVDTKEVRLHFMVDGNPKTYTLIRAEQEPGKPATFTLFDKELAALNCEGWQGEATASVEIGGAPYSAKLVKFDGHVHGPDCDH